MPGLVASNQAAVAHRLRQDDGSVSSGIINRRLGKMTTPKYFYWLIHTMRKTLMFFLYPRLSEFSGISKCLGTFVLSLCRKASGVFGNMVRSAHCKVHNRVSKQVQVSWLSSLDPIEGNIYRKPGFLPAIKKGFPVDFHLIQFNSMNDPTSSFTPEIFRHVGFTQCQAVTMPNLSPFSMGEIQTSPLNGSCL